MFRNIVTNTIKNDGHLIIILSETFFASYSIIFVFQTVDLSFLTKWFVKESQKDMIGGSIKNSTTISCHVIV